MSRFRARTMSEDFKAAEEGAAQALLKIKEAEDRAAALVREARETEGPRLIQSAQEESRKVRDDFIDRARREAEALTRTLIEEARSDAEGVRKRTGEEIARMRAQAGPLMDRAVEEAVRRLAAVLDGGSV
jgi:vacuolar-type H+-ATPase subunit H